MLLTEKIVASDLTPCAKLESYYKNLSLI